MLPHEQVPYPDPATPQSGYTRERAVPCQLCYRVQTFHKAGICRACRHIDEIKD